MRPALHTAEATHSKMLDSNSKARHPFLSDPIVRSNAAWSDALLALHAQPRAARSGTPAYMAPELFHQDGVHSTASDLWALGCVLYECRMGRPPFTSNLLHSLIEDIETKDPPELQGPPPPHPPPPPPSFFSHTCKCKPGRSML